ncbi:MAG: hypothetical protein KAS71_11295 [Bacteroidales bacterium]|nr:hypothetical protein [Bacteroidales bacterium]
MIKTISHITISVMLLLSGTGMAINLHFCQDQLYDFALIVPAHDCCEDGGIHENHCHHDSDMGHSNDCRDETIIIESTSDYFVPAFSFIFCSDHSSDLFFTTQSIYDNNQSTVKSIDNLELNYKKPPTSHEVVLSQIQLFII